MVNVSQTQVKTKAIFLIQWRIPGVSILDNDLLPYAPFMNID